MQSNLSEQLRTLMRRWTSGVTIVSTQLNGNFHGMTVSSFTSVSLEPPIVTISLMKSSRTHDLVIEAGSFGITILSGDQQVISEKFASHGTNEFHRFDGIGTITLVSGSPFVKGGLAFIDCKLIAVYPFNQNSLFIGEVLATKMGNYEKPLLYFDHQYRRLQD